uniref:Kinesin-like protein n=1 Tax=Arion vulgaris TaxID=1028688 RepID=A0A0B7ANB0_9EUPU
MDKKANHKKVKVVVRVRPTLVPDIESCVSVTQNTICIQNHRNREENLQYEFASVFNETATQNDIFDSVQPFLCSALQGQNVSIFAYGPTGSGKTHTMLGVQSDPGVIPRVVQSLFASIQKEKDANKDLREQCPQHSVTFSYMEIYNEKVQDLLSGKQDLPIREDSQHNIFVSGLTEKSIECLKTFNAHFGPASSNRTVAATKLNETSSRSHSILLLKVHCKIMSKQCMGKIYLIDLAGSEDNRRTGNKGIRLKESGAINKSLFVLGEVVDAINHNLARIPYRNSKLTRLLQDSIGGSCQSVMITTIAPESSYYFETYCTLNFATKSKKIVNSEDPYSTI